MISSSIKLFFMATPFDMYAAKANELLNRLSDTLGVSEDKAFRILRSVLHALRNHIPAEESLQVMSQLPMAVKSVYVDQWKSMEFTGRVRHLTHFLDEVREYDKELAGFDFGNDAATTKIVAKVFKTLSAYISPGEIQHLAGVLPTELRQFVTDSYFQEANQ